MRIQIPCLPSCWLTSQTAPTCHFSPFLQICRPTFFLHFFLHQPCLCPKESGLTCCPVCVRLNDFFFFSENLLFCCFDQLYNFKQKKRKSFEIFRALLFLKTNLSAIIYFDFYITHPWFQL